MDDVVLVNYENLPPLKWPLERVIELLPGRDGVARVAALRTPTGLTKRAVNKLCLLSLKEVGARNTSNNYADYN